MKWRHEGEKNGGGGVVAVMMMEMATNGDGLGGEGGDINGDTKEGRMRERERR